MDKLEQLNIEAWKRLKNSLPLTDEKLIKLKREAEEQGKGKLFSCRQAADRKCLNFPRSMGD